MKIFLVICSLFAVTVAQLPSLSCRYFNTAQIYGCELAINNPNGFNNFTEISGIHLQGFTNDDVTRVNRASGYTSNIPKIICNTFPNIDDFDILSAGITEIDDSAFSGCTQITQLVLSYNMINSVSENAFVNLGEIRNLDLGYNLLTTLPENVFAGQQNLIDLTLSNNAFEMLPAGVFRPLENLQNMHMEYSNIAEINSEWFSTNSDLDYLNLAGNRINASANNFANLQHVRTLNLNNNEIAEIPPGVFEGLTNIQSLQMYGNNVAVLRANSFASLDQLITLDIGGNPIEVIDDDAFQGLETLSMLLLARCRIRDLTSNSFAGLSNLTYLDLNFNEIEEIPLGTFASMPNLESITFWNNRLKTLRRNSFGTLTSLVTLNLEGNIMNALDRTIIDDAVNLNWLYFSGNLCANGWFGNFLISRATYLPMFDICFRNTRYIIDTTTENDGIYSFFDAPQPGFVVRVRSDNEVQIALTPFDFLWTPMIEIYIGSTNNTRSVIRINGETNVTAIPTANIIQPNQWNDFRITWANQNVLIFRGSDTFPFMGYTMQTFFPVNFYGLRAVETTATWSVQPLDS